MLHLAKASKWLVVRLRSENKHADDNVPLGVGTYSRKTCDTCSEWLG